MNQGFFAPFKEVPDFVGFSGNILSIGGELQFLVNYQMKKRLFLEFGINTPSFKGIGFKYYGTRYNIRTGVPEFPINLKWMFTKKNNWFGIIGLTTSIHIWNINSYDFNPYDGVNPDFIVTSQDFRKVNPIIEFGVGKRYVNKKGLIFEWLLSYKQGTVITTTYTLKRYNPYIISKLKSRSSTLNVMFRFYLKKHFSTTEKVNKKQ